jgi:diguanylate cyclase (GGDEF)-like protein/PAS domain S-box-containing protein
MQLAAFIRSEEESILRHWQDLATLTQQNFNPTALREQIRQCLMSAAERLEQSPGVRAPTPRWVGQEHTLPVDSSAGLQILRTAIMELWTKDSAPLQAQDCRDMVHFHELLDQMIVEPAAHDIAEKAFDSRLFNTLLQTSPDPLFVLDPQGKFTHANLSAQTLFALPQERIVGKNIFDLGFPFAADLQRNIQQVMANSNISRGELSHLAANGQRETFEYQLAPVKSEQGRIEAVVGIARDITVRKNAEERIWHTAHYDLLTGLPNRRLFFDHLKKEVKNASRTSLPLALLFIDLDGFKEVNDVLGQEAGDRLLTYVAERLNNCVRETDSVARLGDDEFTVTLTSLHQGLHDHDDVNKVAQKIMDGLGEPFLVAGKVVQISASIGVTLCPQDAATPEGLLRNADQAMYLAKKSGRNQIRFFESTVPLKNYQRAG